jgi:hypothetical protein
MKTPLNPDRHQFVNYVTTYLGMGNVVAFYAVTKEHKYVFKMNRGVHNKNIRAIMSLALSSYFISINTILEKQQYHKQF